MVDIILWHHDPCSPHLPSFTRPLLQSLLHALWATPGPEHVPERMPEWMPEKMLDRMSERMPDRMSGRMLEYIYAIYIYIYIYIIYIYMVSIWTSRWYVRNNVRIVCQSGDHSKKVVCLFNHIGSYRYGGADEVFVSRLVHTMMLVPQRGLFPLPCPETGV